MRVLIRELAMEMRNRGVLETDARLAISMLEGKEQLQEMLQEVKSEKKLSRDAVLAMACLIVGDDLD